MSRWSDNPRAAALAASTRLAGSSQHLLRACVAGFSFMEGRHEEGSSLPWHWHDTPTICYVLEGAFTEISDSGPLLCTPATVKFMPAGQRHCDRFDRGRARGLMIEIEPGKMSALEPHASVLERQAAFQGGRVAEIVAGVHSELEQRDLVAPLAIEGLMLELIAVASRLEDEAPRGRPPLWLERARSIIEEGLADHPSLSQIALAVGVHPVTLARTFRRVFGCTVGQYVRHRRIEAAMGDLRDSVTPLAEIALANGFADQSHFSNLFRRHTGVTPSEFRRRFQREGGRVGG
jgi:AraC family transcriptional regulator